MRAKWAMFVKWQKNSLDKWSTIWYSKKKSYSGNLSSLFYFVAFETNRKKDEKIFSKAKERKKHFLSFSSSSQFQIVYLWRQVVESDKNGKLPFTNKFDYFCFGSFFCFKRRRRRRFPGFEIAVLLNWKWNALVLYCVLKFSSKRRYISDNGYVEGAVL